MSPILQLAVLLVGIACCLVCYKFMWRLSVSSHQHSALPPGPPRLPLLGNLHQFPRSKFHLKFTEWAKVYGDIYSLQVLQHTIIVASSPTSVKELIDKRGASTSSRPASIIADMIVPDSMNIGSARHADDKWKLMRKAAVHMLRPENMDRFKPLQRAEATQLMWEMLHKPESFYDNISRYTTSFFLSVIYGHRAPRPDSYASKTFVQMQLEFMLCADVGKAPPVDLFPILTLVPAWFAQWKRRALAVKQMQEELFGYLLDIVKIRLERGERNGAFLEEAYEKRDEWGLDEHMLLHLGGTLLEGSDTSSALLQSMVLFLTAFPECQRKAQEEMDAVVGPDRTPNWEDLENLPYLRAFAEESMRYRPVGPLGLPHSFASDETYNGMFFPKDATLFMNIWGLFHDPRYFEEPEEFRPERFLLNPLGARADVSDDPGRRENMVWGGGRRVCPGIYTARAGLLINLANFVWAFDFAPPLDRSTGRPDEVDLWAYTDGVNLTPLPFRARITARSVAKADTIDRQFREQAQLFEAYERDLDAGDAKFVKRTRG